LFTCIQRFSNAHLLIKTLSLIGAKANTAASQACSKFNVNFQCQPDHYGLHALWAICPSCFFYAVIKPQTENNRSTKAWEAGASRYQILGN